MRSQLAARTLRCAPALAAALFLGLSAAPSARAEGEGEGEVSSGIEKQEGDSALVKGLAALDGLFGEYFVGPLASLIFFDVWFWDDELPPEEMVGRRTADGRKIVRFDEAEDRFFVASERTVNKSAVEPVLAPGVELTYGKAEVEVLEGGDAPVGQVKTDALRLGGAEVIPLAEWEGPAFTPVGDPIPEDAVVTDGLAPFPLVGTRVEDIFKTIPIKVSLPEIDIPLEEGGKVRFEGETVTVLALEGDDVTVGGGEPVPVPVDEIDKTNPDQIQLLFIVAWLVIGATFLTVRMGFINLRAFGHGIKVVKGDYDDPDDPGEISHFQALSSALSATVGLGNIAGVAIAVATGGPGAVFWMIIAGFLGMSSKFTECTLGQLYRHVDEKGIVSGGPMRYLPVGFEKRGFPRVGKVVGVLFALMCIGGSFGGGNMFQANQAFAAVAERIPAMTDYSWAFGLVMAVLVGLVIIGGIKRIGAAASFLVPAMCGIYLLAGLWILVAHGDKIPSALGTIVGEAFSFEAGFGGFVGVLITGFQRAAFSNEAGVGSAAIAHSAASTPEPVREGIVAALGPFIDTIIVCSMTGLVVVITGAYLQDTGDGVLMTSFAFGTVLGWFPWILSFAVLLFAFSTMISWSYYGERCFTLLFGKNTSMLYRVIFCFFVFFGSVFKLGHVLDFSDLAILGMAFPNFVGLYLMSGEVKEKLNDYWGRLKAGKMEPPPREG